MGILLLAGAVGVLFATPFNFGASTEEAPYQVKIIRNVTYAEPDGTDLQADLFIPEGDHILPGVLMVHGGAWFTGSRWQMQPHAAKIASNGFVVVVISYRLAPKHKFPAQLHDCLTAIRWMRKNAQKYRIDPQRIAGYGYSAGAHLVTLAAMSADTAPSEWDASRAAGDAEVSATLQAVVAGGTPCDFSEIPQDNRVLAYFLGGSRKEVPHLYRLASPRYFVSPADPPAFFFHAENDRLVSKEAVQRMSEQLQSVGVRSEVHIVPSTGHISVFFHREPPKRAAAFLTDVFSSAAPARPRIPPSIPN